MGLFPLWLAKIVPVISNQMNRQILPVCHVLVQDLLCLGVHLDDQTLVRYPEAVEGANASQSGVRIAKLTKTECLKNNQKDRNK